MNGDVGPKESSEQWRDRTSEQPLTEWVEDQLGAPESVFLPSVQLVVTGERDTLLEFAFRVRSPSNDIAFDLKRDGDLEVLRHVLLRPYSHLAVIGVWVHTLLERRPSDETGRQRCQGICNSRIVADEWSDWIQISGNLTCRSDHTHFLH